MDCRYLLISIALLFTALPLYGQYALDFDGTNDFAEVPHAPSLEFMNEITAEVWFKVESIPPYGTHRIFVKKRAEIYNVFTVAFREGDLIAAISNSKALTVAGETVPIGLWNHVALTYDGSVIRLYLNGDEMENRPASGLIQNEATPVSFGRYDASFGQYFQGSVDEARLWSIGRSGDEIRSTMNGELSGFEEGLVGYWKFNEGVGDLIFDSTPNENDGQLGPYPSNPTWITRAFPPPTPVDLIINPTDPTVIPRGDILEFITHIYNNRENSVEGDYWLSVMLPNYVEVLIPEGLLNYSNPLHGQVFGYSYVTLSNQLFIPTMADTGSYQLIGRIGHYPDGIVDEESFGFQVVE